MDNKTKLSLQLTAAKARLRIVSMVYAAASGHPGGSLSCVDMLVNLYFNQMRIDPRNPAWEERDRFVLSKGHCSPALYSVLALRGFFPETELNNFRSIDHHLSGHAEMKYVKGVDMSTGSLGQGISAAVGMALGGKQAKKSFRVYALLGDGEIAEGQVWEAFMSAAKYKLSNLRAIIDVNGLQIDGRTADVMPSEPLDKKLEAFNWNVVKCGGHDFDALSAACEAAEKVTDRPTAILMDTIKGKGVSFMEGDYNWHGKAPDAEQYAAAKAELEAVISELEQAVSGGDSDDTRGAV